MELLTCKARENLNIFKFHFKKRSKYPPSASTHILASFNLEGVALRKTSRSFICLTATAIPFLCSVYFAFIHHACHVIPHMKVWRNEVRWSRWPILRSITVKLSVTDLRIQVLRHVSTEMLACPSWWKNICSRVCSGTSFKGNDSSFGITAACLLYTHIWMYGCDAKFKVPKTTNNSSKLFWAVNSIVMIMMIMMTAMI
jgi:hypothetical protein